MRLPLLLLALPLCGVAADQAVVLDATWDRFSQHTALRYTLLGIQSRIESTAADKPDPYLLIDTAQDQRITVYRHNRSWRLDPLEPKPRNNSLADSPSLAIPPQPSPGIGPQGQIGPGAGPAALPPIPGYGASTGHGPAIPQSAIRDPQSPDPTTPGSIGPQGQIGPRTGPGSSVPNQPSAPAIPAMPQMPAAPSAGYGAGSPMPNLPQMPASMGPQGRMGPGAGSMTPGAGMGAGFGPGRGDVLSGGMPMPPPSAMNGREQTPTLTKTDETQPLIGRTAVKYTVTGRMMETIEIWAVPDTEFGPFFAYRTQPQHHFGPVDLQEQWDSLLRHEHLFPLLAVFKQGDREIARFTATTIKTRELAKPATFFAPPEKFYRCPPDPF
jgi:hypothetical protein